MCVNEWEKGRSVENPFLMSLLLQLMVAGLCDVIFLLLFL